MLSFSFFCVKEILVYFRKFNMSIKKIMQIICNITTFISFLHLIFWLWELQNLWFLTSGGKSFYPPPCHSQHIFLPFFLIMKLECIRLLLPWLIFPLHLSFFQSFPVFLVFKEAVSGCHNYLSEIVSDYSPFIFFRTGIQQLVPLLLLQFLLSMSFY